MTAPTAAPPPRILASAAANYVGRFWAGAINAIVAPIYLRYLGVEGFGVVAFATTVAAILSVFDLGLGATLNRELARSTAPTVDGTRLATACERVCLVLGALACGAFAIASPLIARRWLAPRDMAVDAVARALLLMAAYLAAQWPSALYASALLGLHRQGRLNALRAAFATVQAAGSVALLALVAADLSLFFAWQAACAAAQAVALRVVMRRELPPADAITSSMREVRPRARFAAGVFIVGLLGTVLTQMDRLFTSRLLPLVDFGYYSLAATLAGLLAYAVGPMYMTMYPTLSRLVAAGDERRLASAYHAGCQALAALVLPTAAVTACFSSRLLPIYLRDPVAASRAAPVLSLLLVGTALNGLVTMPFALQLAAGWTSLSVWKNAIAVAILLPVMTAVVTRWGGVGAAGAWIALNAAYALIEIPIMHRRLLRGQAGAWYARDVVVPAVAAIAVAVVGSAASRGVAFTPGVVAAFLTTLVASCGAVLAVSPAARAVLRAALSGGEAATGDEGTAGSVACWNCSSPTELALVAADRNRRTTDERFGYRRCDRCGMLFIDDIPADLGRYYADGYAPYAHATDAAAIDPLEAAKAAVVARSVPQGAVLEIGPGGGGFCRAARVAGFAVSAIEMDAACCDRLQQEGIEALRSDDPAAALRGSDRSYDAIALWHVVEHLRDPFEVLDAAARRLRGGGALVVAAPNPASLQLALFGSRWIHLDAPRHLCFPTVAVLRDRLQGAGLDLESVIADGPLERVLDRMGWQGSLEGLARGRLARRGLRVIGRVIDIVARRLVPRGRRSAFTLVFRRRQVSPEPI